MKSVDFRENLAVLHGFKALGEILRHPSSRSPSLGPAPGRETELFCRTSSNKSSGMEWLEIHRILLEIDPKSDPSVVIYLSGPASTAISHCFSPGALLCH